MIRDSWACGVARLKVLENLRQRKRATVRQRKRATVLSEAAIVALTEEAPSPEVMAEQEDALQHCLERLAPKARNLLWRRYSSRQSSVEMAEAAGMTSTAVRVALTKARAFLRDCVGNQLKKSLES